MIEALDGLGAAPFLIVTVFITVTVIMPWMVMHHALAWRRAHAMTPRDERMLWDLWSVAKRLEARVGALEDLIELDAPIGREGRMDHVRKTH